MASIVADGNAETSIITQFGVTFYFAEPVVHGTFANGDHWVQAPVTVTRITPDWDGIRHGWEINPKVEVAQGFDTRGAGYSPAKRPSLPITLTSNCSLVKVVGHADSVEGSYVKTAVVLTVLTKEPVGVGSDYFRPPYCGDAKPLIPTKALHASLLPRYPMPTSAPSLSTVASNFAQCLRMDHHPTHPRFFRPTDAMAGYQPENTAQLNEAMLRLMGDDEPAAKWQALVLFTQHALDRAVIVTQGYRQGGTGHNPNHRVVAAWAALLLGMEEAQKYLAVAEGFHEDTFLYDSPVDGRALWGEAASERQYWNYLMGLGGSRSRRDPYGFIDGGRLTDGPGGAYQFITSQSLKGQALIYRLFPQLKAMIPAHRLSTLDRYAERWVTHGVWALPDPVASFDGTVGNYGITFGPDGRGGYIRGGGRFPSMHGAAADSGQYKSPFVDDMWQAYASSSQRPEPPRPPKALRVQASGL